MSVTLNLHFYLLWNRKDLGSLALKKKNKIALCKIVKKIIVHEGF